jgi:iron complex outermembrane receptor protein
MSHRLSITRWAAAVVSIALAGSLGAQAPTGTISGKVVDAATKLPISEVRVVVVGTQYAAPTNKDGEFRLVNIRAGATTVGVLRIGYKSSQQTVTVVANQTVTANF